MNHGGDNVGNNPNDAAFLSARDALIALGGGVLYFPAGDYVFTESIGLVDNVVLRGADPVIADATDPDYRPPSRLIFPKFNFVASGTGTPWDTAFKGIGMASGSGINVGLVNLDVNRASISAGGGGTNSENVVILGVRSNNVASPQPWTVPTPEQNDWQIHPYRFASNISASAYRNVLVANCMVNDAHYWLHRQDDGKDMTGAPADLASLEIDDFEEPGYLIKDGTVWKTLEEISGEPYVFEYTDHYGINVQGSTGEWGAPPWVQPNLFYSGAVIRDNWIYTTMRVKVDCSGRGLVVKDNVMKDRQGKTRWYDPNGEKRVSNSATLENRGIDWRGHDVLIEGNEIEVFRHLLNGGPYSSVDGEGILHQEVHGTTIDNVIIRNNTVNAYIGIYKMPYTRNVLIEGNTLISPAYIQVESDTNNNDFPMYNVIVRNNIVDKGISIRADYYSPGVLSADVYDNLMDGTLEIEDHAVHSGNTKKDGVTPATVDVRTGAVAIDPPAEGLLFADTDPDEMLSGETANFTVLVETPSVTVERVTFYRHKTLMHTDENPPYTYQYVSDGTRALWSAKIEQPEQAGGFDPYTALLVEEAPSFPSPPAVELTGPDPLGSYLAPEDLALTAQVTPGSAAIDRVEFYSGGTYLGMDADGLAPYTYTWTGVPFGVYSLTAKVWDADGAVLVSDPVELFVEDVPNSAPANLQAVAVSDTEIDLTWENPAVNADGFDIERSPAGSGSWGLVDSVDVSVLNYRDSGLAGGTEYDYRVIATNIHGSSDPSNTATETTYPTASTVPGAPVGFKARAVNTTAMKLDWIPGTGIAFGFRVEWRDDPLDPWVLLGEYPASVTTAMDSGLSAGSVRHYRVRAWNNIGDSAWAETSGVTLTTAFPGTFSVDGLPWPIPGRIEFEDYNPGAYYDTTGGNEGSSDYRYPDSVDMGGGGTGVTIGWIDNGEWMEYTIRIDQAGLYDVDVAYASPYSTGSLSLQLDGLNIAPAVVFANTGAWSTYQLHTLSGIYLPAGHYILRAYVENSGFNLDYVDFSLLEAATYANWSATFLAGSPEPGELANADGDAYLNIFDMLLGLDPLTPDPAQESVDIAGGTGVLEFPVAKGLDGVSWSVGYSHDLGQAGPWNQVTSAQLQVVAEDPARIWFRAQVPAGADDKVFFRIQVE
ncbi:MAG: fibronectin type III domain-containing protein [Oceanipulchritudo sp.]